MQGKTCCVTGHRTIRPDRQAYMEGALRREVRQAIADGYTHFISGFASGVDLLFAGIVVDEKKRHPELALEAALPYPGRLNTPDGQFHELIRACRAVKVECERYAPHCYARRNRYMVEQSQRVIAVYDGRDHGGTLYTLRRARALGRDVRLIRV